MTATRRLFLGRRQPVVQIDYDVEGDEFFTKIELPFVTGVLANFSGMRPRPLLGDIEERRFIEVDRTTFDACLHAAHPRIAFSVPNTIAGAGLLNVDLTFDTLADFAPVAVARRLKPLRDVLELRDQIGQSVGGGREAADILGGLDEGASPRSIIAALDERLNAQLNLILHHDDFRQIEGTWRGLHYLVNNAETSAVLKLLFIDIGKEDLAANPGAVLGTLVQERCEARGREPFGLLVGDYYFDDSPWDIQLLRDIGQIAAAAHAPFIAGASPRLAKLSSWQELTRVPYSSALFSGPEHEAWASLRQSEPAKYLGLTMPRYLARPPYRASEGVVESFEFREDVATSDHDQFTWSNAAFLMAGNINRSFALNRWFGRMRGIESGGAVHGLATDAFPTDHGDIDQNCPTEIAVSEQRERELTQRGLMPLERMKYGDAVAFISAHSLHQPAEPDDLEERITSALAARLPYLFACCRFAHYMKCGIRDNFAHFSDREDMVRWLNNWVNGYVDGDPATSSQSVKVNKPLSSAEVVVEDTDGGGDPDSYLVKFYLRPQFQLEGLTASICLISRLPRPRRA